MSKAFRMKIDIIRTIGSLLTVVGLCMIIGFGAAASRQIEKAEVSTGEYVETVEEKQPVGLSDNKLLMNSHILFFGAFMILSGTSCFFLPCTDAFVIVWKRSRAEDAEEISNMQDDEFDYPDDDFDYILDEEIRQRMIELRNEKIKEKRKKNRRFRYR